MSLPIHYNVPYTTLLVYALASILALAIYIPDDFCTFRASSALPAPNKTDKRTGIFYQMFRRKALHPTYLFLDVLVITVNNKLILKWNSIQYIQYNIRLSATSQITPLFLGDNDQSETYR